MITQSAVLVATPIASVLSLGYLATQYRIVRETIIPVVFGLSLYSLIIYGVMSR